MKMSLSPLHKFLQQNQTQFLCRLKSCLGHVRDLQWWEFLKVVRSGPLVGQPFRKNNSSSIIWKYQLFNWYYIQNNYIQNIHHKSSSSKKNAMFKGREVIKIWKFVNIGTGDSWHWVKYEDEYGIVPFLLDIILKQKLNVYIVIIFKHLSELYWFALMFF